MTTRTYAVMDCDVSPVSYLTAGKEYEVRAGRNHRSFEIDTDATDDPEEPKDAYCLWERCAHLHGGNWRRIDRD